MIVFPENWRDLEFIEKESNQKFSSSSFIGLLSKILRELNIQNLAYSGGIDSSLILALLTKIFKEVETFVIACRKSHPDILFSKIGSQKYKSNHHEFFPTTQYLDPTGNDAVQMFFSNLKCESIITCDGIDELTGGYYDHLDCKHETYTHYLNRLVLDHLIPLNENSGKIEVFLPFLAPRIINLFLRLPLVEKVNIENRKIPIKKVAYKLRLPKKIIERNKYGFCDAFLPENK